MAIRFASVEDEELDNILNNRDSSNTKNVIRMATNVLREYTFTITMITEIQFCFWSSSEGQDKKKLNVFNIPLAYCY